MSTSTQRRASIGKLTTAGARLSSGSAKRRRSSQRPPRPSRRSRIRRSSPGQEARLPVSVPGRPRACTALATASAASTGTVMIPTPRMPSPLATRAATYTRRGCGGQTMVAAPGFGDSSAARRSPASSYTCRSTSPTAEPPRASASRQLASGISTKLPSCSPSTITRAPSGSKSTAPAASAATTAGANSSSVSIAPSTGTARVSGVRSGARPPGQPVSAAATSPAATIGTGRLTARLPSARARDPTRPSAIAHPSAS